MYFLFYLLTAKKKWRESLLEEYKKIIIEHLARTDYAGIITHFCDCFLDELYTTLPHISTVHFIELLNPIIDILKSKNNSLIYNSIKEHLLRSLVNDYETMRESILCFFVFCIMVRGRSKQRVACVCQCRYSIYSISFSNFPPVRLLNVVIIFSSA